MSLEAWFTLAVIVGLVTLLAGGRAPAAVSMLGATVFLLFIGIVSPAQAFAGFSNEGPSHG